MSHVSRTEPRLLVLVTSEGPAAQTVEYAVREARDSWGELEAPVFVDIRVVLPGTRATAPEIEDRIRDVIATFEAEEGVRIHIDTVRLEGAEPDTRTEQLLERLESEDFSRLIIDADSEFAVDRLRDRFGVTTVELAPTDTPAARRRLLHPGGWRRLVTIFGLTYVFYLAIGGFAGGLDLLTGTISAGVVALSLSQVALREEPELDRTGRRLVRTAAFLPVLLWEIVKANFAIAAIILHPRLPIDPTVGTLRTDTRDNLERMVLANSITLTPGTLTIDVHEREFTIHALTADALRDLEEGRLIRLVRWIFQRAESGASGGDEQ